MFAGIGPRTAVLVAALLLASACTSDSDAERADEAEAQLAVAQADLATAQADAAGAASTIARLQSDLTTAQATLRDTQTMLTSTERTLERMRGENTSLLDSQATFNEQYEALDAALHLLAEAVCLGVNTEPPADLSGSLVSWLKQTQNNSGEVPDELGVTIIDVAGRDGWWVFTADFDSRFQPGVFLRDPHNGFQILWGGFASSVVELWTYLLRDNPGLPAGLVTCVDLSPFVDA